MANTVTQQTSKDVVLSSDEDVVRDDTMLLAHRMAEDYCGRKFPIQYLTATYSIDDNDGMLRAIPNIPINKVFKVVDNHGALQSTSNNDMAIFPLSLWTGNLITVEYGFGLPFIVYKAIIKLGKTIQIRPDFAPEITGVNEPFDLEMNPMFRTAIASDVRGMLFPYKEFGW